MFGFSIKKNTRRQNQVHAERIHEHKFKIIKTMFVFAFLAFAIPSTVIALQTQNEQDISTALATGGGAGATYALTFAAIGNIDDPTDKYTQGNRIAWEVHLVHIDQIDNTVAWPYPNAAREVADIPLKAGEYPLQFACHNNPKYNATGEKGDYTIDPTKMFDLVLGDTFKNQVLNFVEEFGGGKFIVFFREVETADQYILGTYDKPMFFQNYELKNDDASVALCKFQNKSIRQYYKYVGSLQSVAATAIATDATELVVGTSGKYETANDNTVPSVLATVSGIAPADEDRTLTIYGTGGANPHTIADNDVFILKNNATWTGNAGSRITFRIMDTGTLSEISRVQT